MNKEYKLHMVKETWESMEGRKCKSSRYSLKKWIDGRYRFDGPFVFIYRHYDEQGVLTSRKLSVVCEVGGTLVNYDLKDSQAVDTLQAIRTTITDQEG